MDVDAITPGEDWTRAISQALAKCGVMLVLIGDRWGQVRSNRPARIGDTDDWVRHEIEAALDRSIPIIPVLLQDAVMPNHADLPNTLVRLSDLQAIQVRHDTFESDAARLLAAVDRELGTRPGLSLARRLLVPLLTLICLVAVGLATWILTTTYSDQAVADEIAEPIGTAVNPFLEGVGQDVTQTPPPKAAGQVRGDTEGLYGGTRRGTNCDAAKLVAFLQTHPEKGAAWAGVLKLTLQQIPSFVSQLTPLILRADTRVTNHGFEDGRVTSSSSILQAGTAVLVDKRGVPVVKCFCGNPLTPPRPVAQSYQGKAWPGFDAQKVIVIKPAPIAVKSFKAVDHTTGRLFSKKTGLRVASPNSEQPDQAGAGSPKETTPQSGSPSPSATADTASPTPSDSSSASETASPTPSVTPSTADPTIESESSPTESDRTDRPTGGGSPDPTESPGTGEGTDSRQEGGESQGSSGTGQTE